MNTLHSIQINNDLAALRGSKVEYNPQTKQLTLLGEPFRNWAFLSREDAAEFCSRHNATLKN
jgi:hypothetical protein